MKLGASRFTSDSRDPRTPTRTGLESLTGGLSGEVGLSHQLELAFELPYAVATARYEDGTHYSNHSLGDLRLQLNRAVLPSIPLSAGLELQLPLYRAIGEEGRNALVEVEGRLYPAANFPEVGEGSVDLTPKLMLGHSFYPTRIWISGELGYRFRLASRPQAVQAALNLGGWAILERAALGLFASGALNVTQAASTLERPAREFAHVSLYGFVSLAPFAPWLQVGASFGTVLASNTQTGNDVSLWLALTR